MIHSLQLFIGGQDASVGVTDLQRRVREGILFLPRLNRLLHSRKKEVILGSINDLTVNDLELDHWIHCFALLSDSISIVLYYIC